MSMPPTPDRPHLAPSYGVDPQAIEGVLAWDVADDQLRASRNYWIVTTGSEGNPHATPVWGIWHQGALYFGTDAASRKARDLAVRPAMVAHLESGDDVVIIHGDATRATDLDLLSQVVDAYEIKYGFRPDPSDPAACFFSLMPKTVYAWRESDFPASATRWNLGAS